MSTRCDTGVSSVAANTRQSARTDTYQ